MLVNGVNWCFYTFKRQFLQNKSDKYSALTGAIPRLFEGLLTTSISIWQPNLINKLIYWFEL